MDEVSQIQHGSKKIETNLILECWWYLTTKRQKFANLGGIIRQAEEICSAQCSAEYSKKGYFAAIEAHVAASKVDESLNMAASSRSNASQSCSIDLASVASSA